MKNKTILLAILLTIVSCGGKSGGDRSSSATGDNNGPEIPQEEERSEQPTGISLSGKYKAFLRPLNTQINGYLPYGAAEFDAQNEMMAITTYLNDGQRVKHMQNVHSGSACPTLNDDINKDGLIDIEEAYKVVGSVIIPLDGDLSSQMKGQEYYPTGKTFTYRESSSINSIVEDLRASDEDPNDHISKIPQDQSFILKDKVVLIHGTGINSRVPETVKTMEGIPSHLSIPIACGVIKEL